MSIIELRQVSKTYGIKKNRYSAVNNVSFRIEPGEFLGIMGPSGAGKSTLLNMASTLDFPTSGTVLLNGKVTTGLNERKLADFRKNKSGYIFQDFSLLENLTVQENIELPLLADHVAAREVWRRVRQVAQLLLLESVLNHYPSELSVGQKQRVAAGRAIIKRPAIIFADEPTGSLDSRSATELLQFLSEVNQKEQTTIMMVTHDPFTASYCKRIIFVRDGQIFSEINRAESRQDFFEKIINMQAVIGGGPKR
ncbi:hypothetical protein FC62_GL000525 [Amylolactobacillus amylotrophicus DSM 20534]|uniref:ABC transporter domain-containing protein n=1 Tax=Amylolactobacillus amylotrophicus DSM 20534 TaxID=1423722 RepID=A0A0R1H4X6_9LACO|nr:ABC transporter ATP-binding protein [Amylolactobacillus amylotrophicus]KRK38833.1 hypothetical protein FC62_GL000525 [Amylolactobacillus amylotrophicus DSM 20534]